MWLVARMLADKALHIARILAVCNILLPKVVQVEDYTKYEMDLIICHWGRLCRTIVPPLMEGVWSRRGHMGLGSRSVTGAMSSCNIMIMPTY